MTIFRTQVIAAGVAGLVLVAGSACASAGGGGDPAAGSTPAGEAGGEASLVTYVDSRYNYRVVATGKMKPNAEGTASVVGASERLEIAVVQGARASDPALLAHDDVAMLPRSITSFHLVSGPAAITLNG